MVENILPTSAKNILHGIGNIYIARGKAIIYRSKIRVSPNAAVEGRIWALVGLDQAEVGAEEDLVITLLVKVDTVSPDLARVILRQKLRGWWSILLRATIPQTLTWKVVPSNFIDNREIIKISFKDLAKVYTCFKLSLAESFLHLISTTSYWLILLQSTWVPNLTWFYWRCLNLTPEYQVLTCAESMF